MIDLAGIPFSEEGVTFFPDHAEPGRFHYLPDRPKLRLGPDGAPELSLLKYRLDANLQEALGAGLLSMTVDLSVDPELLERVRGRLAAHAGVDSKVRMAPLAAAAGSCELILIDRSSEDAEPSEESEVVGFGLVERILEAASPALYGDNAATFQAVLSAEGVALVEGALRGGGLPAGVVYTLETLAIRPALRAVITARWRDVYHFYENRLHGGQLLLATDIGPTMETLIHDELITIEVDELVPPDERTATYQASLDQAQRYVMEELFKPTLGQAPPAEGGGESDDGALAAVGGVIKGLVGMFSFTYSLRQVDRDELKTFRYQLGVSRAEKITLAPQGTFSVLLAEESTSGDIDRLIVEVEPTASPEMRFDVAAAIDLASEGIDHLEVSLRYGERDEQLLLDAVEPRKQVSFWHEEELGTEVSYRYEVHLSPDGEGLSGVLASEKVTTSDRVLRLNPRDLYQRIEVRAVAQGVPFDLYPKVLLDLRAVDPVAEWSTTESFELSQEQPEATMRVRSGLEGQVRFERRLRYIEADGGEIVEEWDRIRPGILVVGDPQPEINDLLILGSARFGTAVRRLIVELRSLADPTRQETRILTGEEPSATWAWAAGDDAERGYEYRVTVHATSGDIREGKWLAGTSGKLIVGEGGRLREVELILVGKSLADLDLLALKVRFAFRDEEAGLFAEDEFLVENTRTPIRWSYPVADPERQQFSYQLTMITSSGTIETKDPVTTADLMVIQPLT